MMGLALHGDVAKKHADFGFFWRHARSARLFDSLCTVGLTHSLGPGQVFFQSISAGFCAVPVFIFVLKIKGPIFQWKKELQPLTKQTPNGIQVY
jgi:hypothetical protein